MDEVMKIEGLPVDLQIAAAVNKQAQTVQKIEGQAAIDLITAANPDSPPPVRGPDPDGRGSLINTKA